MKRNYKIMYREVCFSAKYLLLINFILAVELLQSGLLRLQTNWIIHFTWLFLYFSGCM